MSAAGKVTTIDGQPRRIAECPIHIEATVVAGGRLNRFIVTLAPHRSRAILDAWVDTIDLRAEEAAVPLSAPSS